MGAQTGRREGFDAEGSGVGRMSEGVGRDQWRRWGVLGGKGGGSIA